MKTKQELKKYFENGDIPVQEEFWEWQESYWHKDEKIPSDKLEYDFSKKADLIGGKVPASQLPSYVDDVLEFGSLINLPQFGESGKIYITIDTNRLYRWTGTQYIDITQGDVGNLQAVTDRGNETTKGIKIQGIGYGGSSQQSNILISDDVMNLNGQSNNTITIGINSKPYGSDQIVIGSSTCVTSDSSSIGNTIIGHSSYSNGLYSSENTVIGYGTFNNAKSSSGNTIIGTYAANGGGDGNYLNIILGQSAGSYLSANSRNNIILGNNSHFNNVQLQNSLYIHNNGSSNPVILSDALISGNFADRYVNINGKFSITPGKMPSADSSYTKNIVAKPDGTFGWEDKTSSESIPLVGTDPLNPVTGDIYINKNSSTHTILSDGYVFCSDITSTGTMMNTSSLEFIDAGTEIVIISKEGITTQNTDYVITCNGSAARGLTGALDYTSNIGKLDYIQKLYADKQHSYTTQEELTGGTWINGKPVYKKTVVFTQIPRTGLVEFKTEFPDIDTIISNEMFTEWQAIDTAFAGNQWRNKAFITIERKLATIELMGDPDYDYSAINSFTLTLEYTKK